MKSATIRTSGVLRHIEHLASLNLDPHIAIPEMLRTLSKVMPAADADFYWVGAGGEVLDAWRPDAAARASAVPGDGDLFRVHLAAKGLPQALLAIRRPAALAERERRLFRAAAPSLQRALAARATVQERFDDLPERTGVLTVTADGRLIGNDPHALLLVAEMDGRPLVGTGVAVCSPGERLPSFIADLCSRNAARPGQVPDLHRVTRWGAYRARVFAQYGGADHAAHHVVVISKHLPQRVGLMRTLETLDLSPRERQAAFQIGIGADAAQGAAALGVSLATWRSYVKRVYLRLDVRDRLELFTLLNRRVPS